MSSMGYVKYGLVFLLSAWMFFLGIIVGRGTSPVTFDTQSFQKRLANIAGQLKQKQTVPEPELQFYEVLKEPAGSSTESIPDDRTQAGGLVADEAGNDEETGSEAKLSLKTQTQTKNQTASASETVTPVVPSGAPKAETPKPSSVEPERTYTIQVAAFKELGDALKLIQTLEKKGHTCYRTMGAKGDAVWHRVRIGSFSSRAQAGDYLAALEKDGIKGLIIQKD